MPREGPRPAGRLVEEDRPDQSEARPEDRTDCCVKARVLSDGLGARPDIGQVADAVDMATALKNGIVQLEPRALEFAYQAAYPLDAEKAGQDGEALLLDLSPKVGHGQPSAREDGH